MGRAYSVPHAAALAAQLPAGARSPAAASPDAAFTPAEHLLEAIEYNTHVIWWQKTKEGKKNRRRPQPAGIGRRAKPKGAGKPVDVDELPALLARPRKDVMRDGQRAG